MLKKSITKKKLVMMNIKKRNMMKVKNTTNTEKKKHPIQMYE